MMHASVAARFTPCFTAVRAAAAKRARSPSQMPKKAQNKEPSKNTNPGFGGKKKDPLWQCVTNCGACCKLDKGPTFPSPEEIFDDPSDIQLFKSLVGPDGWCIHYEKNSRRCSIYAERPYFCRVEPEIFETLYGIETKRFNKEACSCCVDTIKAVYGTNSEELENFNQAIWSSKPK